MKLTDTTDPNAYAGMKTLVSNASAARETALAEKFRLHLLGMYVSDVGSEWSSHGRRQSDYLHHMDITLSGRRQVVCGDQTHDLEPGQIWFLPGNTPVGRSCEEPCKVLFFKFCCECLPGVDPLLDWPGREPRLAATCDVGEWREWTDGDRPIGVVDLLLLRGRLLSWLVTAVPELDEVVTRHLASHSQFTGVFDLIERELGADLRLSTLAENYGTTVEAFSMAFSRGTGMSPKEYLTRRLNQEALQLVINTDLKLKQVAERLRFTDEFYFSRFFKKFNGSSPKDYRNRLRRR